MVIILAINEYFKPILQAEMVAVCLGACDVTMSMFWRFFEVSEMDSKDAICNDCSASVMRGKARSLKMTQ